jgi:phosphoglycolate phosphatase
MIKNFIFDLDGTLIDSAEDIRRVLKNSILKNGFKLPENVFIPVGPTLDRITHILIPDIDSKTVAKILEDYRDEYLTETLDKTVPFDGVIEMLKYIKERKMNSFIATFKPRDAADIFVKKFFSGLYIDCITPDDLPFFDKRNSIIKSDMLKFLMDKCGLKADECIMIGDSESDICGAKEAGIKAIAAGYGYGKPSELINADIKIKNPQDLIEKIKELIDG